ncbi:MAG: methionine adenosyltransferase domain-containing protein [Flavobacteriales bacterium]
MSVRHGLFSSESVSEGHPDKLADRISDAVHDEFLRHDPSARVACETLLADQCVVVAGEFKTRRPETFRAVRERAVTIVSDVLRDAGYRDSATGIDPERCEIQVRFNGQSADIHQGVDRQDGVIGASDQGLMFGYACDDTPELMPAPIVFAHRLVRRQAELRRSGALPWLGPDAKSQVSFRYEAGRWRSRRWCCPPSTTQPSTEGVSPARSAEIAEALRREFDLAPAGINRCLDLQRPIDYPTAAYGHFGRDDLDLPWEAGVTPSRAGSSGEPGGR